MTAFADQQESSWSTPPVAGKNISSGWAIELSDTDFNEWANTTYHEHCGQAETIWRSLGVFETKGKTVFDYGCGFGCDARKYAELGNEVVYGDISDSNLKAAGRMISAGGLEAEPMRLAVDSPFYGNFTFDIFHANGVLHHTPYFTEILRKVSCGLRPNGEIRLMLYSDETWRWATGTEPPESVYEDPSFGRFVRTMDAVGYYADWYSANKIVNLVGGFLDLVHHEYLDNDRGYSAAILRHK